VTADSQSCVMSFFFYLPTILFKSFHHVHIHLWSIYMYLQHCINNSETCHSNSPQFSCLLIVFLASTLVSFRNSIQFFWRAPLIFSNGSSPSLDSKCLTGSEIL